MKRTLMLMIIFGLSISIYAQNWIIEPVDTSGIVFDCSIVTDTMNYPHIAYCYSRDLGGNRCTNWIKYARWNGSTWEFQPVETAADYSFFATAKLCLDNQNRPHIVYIKDTCLFLFKYAYYDGDSWQISTVDSLYNLRSHHIVRNCINMTLSDDGIPHISYSFIDLNDSTRGIRRAYKSRDSWIIQTVWEKNRISHSYLSITAIDLDKSGYPVIAFEDWSYASTDTGYLFCARFNGQFWEIDTVDSYQPQPRMYWIYSLKVDGSNRVHIFYQYGIAVSYAVASGDTWNIEPIAGNGVGSRWGDMILDGNEPKVVFSSSMTYLKYGYKTEERWQFEIIDPTDVGLYPSLAKDNKGGMHVSYDRGKRLFYARRELQAIEEQLTLDTERRMLEIYPNPARSYLTIRLPETTGRELKIFDVSGKLVREITPKPEEKIIRISLKEMKPGVYILEQDKRKEKFIITR